MKKKILIVEDEAIIAMTYKKALQNNYNITDLVATGMEAIDSIKKTLPDLILMDIKLKGNMNGIEAAKQIQNIYYIPVLFLSGNTDIEVKQQAIRLNPCRYLQKPTNQKELVRTVKSIIQEQ